ncbi:MAG: cyclic pyranopterin monophosphate synthase MoaC [Pseudomonadota bacterium]
MSKLTHLTSSGEAHMVDVGEKSISQRVAIASGCIKMQPETLELVLSGNAKKGDVLATARIAGVMAAKKTAELIPLCHPIGLTSVNIDILPDADLPGFIVKATAKVSGQTGVEMEAMTACSITCLTIYDMVKAADRGMEIGTIVLEEKSGGKSGTWRRNKAIAGK